MSDDGISRSWRARLARAFSGRAVTPNLSPESDSPPDGRFLALKAADFERLKVADVMVPRADITAVEIDTPLAELARLFAEAAHSRLPIYRETLDDPVGVAHIKDVVGHLAPDASGQHPEGWAERKILPTIRRPLLYAPPSMKAVDLLLRMQTRRMHLALVVDEFGGTDGLVSLEDLLEPIVGDIEDEHDEEEAPGIRARGPGLWEADARLLIEDFERAAGMPADLPDEDEDDFETLGGLVFTLAGRVPERGEVIPHPGGLEFEVLDADPRRIKRVRIRASRPSGEGEVPPAAGELA
ncbi:MULTISPECIES: hemolysin family protein [Hyphobacterium]|uniref:Hemolysin family protein n=1 Tax=Hyphobacterium vulgare TaxID=1736751 RepID=A0ABV6ZXF8_9PROT